MSKGQTGILINHAIYNYYIKWIKYCVNLILLCKYK